MFNFVGRGSAFNTSEGNNSCFLKDNGDMFLIDCGSNIFDRLLKYNLLDDVDNLDILITHTHPDHVGSLGDLIFYMYFIKKVKVNVLCPEDLYIKDYLGIVGVWDGYYNYVELDKEHVLSFSGSMLNIKPFLVEHVDYFIGINCYGYDIDFKGKRIYYSGDSRSISKIHLKNIKNNLYDFIYQDVSSVSFEGNPHLSFYDLCLLITDKEIRNKIYCMHIDGYLDEDYVKSLGFNVVQLYNYYG